MSNRFGNTGRVIHVFCILSSTFHRVEILILLIVNNKENNLNYENGYFSVVLFASFFTPRCMMVTVHRRYQDTTPETACQEAALLDFVESSLQSYFTLIF